MPSVELSHRQIYILPTRRGVGLMLLIMLLLLASAIYQNNLAYLLTFMLAGILLVSVLHSFRALLGIRLSSGDNDPVFAGDSVFFPVQISNPSNYARHALSLTLKEFTPVSVALAEQSHKKLSIRAVSQQRGWFKPNAVTLSSTWPLGIFRAWSVQRNLGLQVLIYPKPGDRLLPFPESFIEREQAGWQHQRGSDDFSGLQPYYPGDPIRHIHWKAVAKGQGVHVKQYSGGQSGDLWLDWQATPGENTESRLSVLCRWVLEAEKSGIRYGLRLPGQVLKPATGVSHYRQCLTALALFDA